MRPQQNKLRFLWLAIFAGLAFFVSGRWQFPAAAWVAPIFALRFYRDSEKGGRAFLWLWLATAVPTIFAWHNATAMHFMGAVIEPVFFIATIPIGLIPYAVDRLYHRRWVRDGRFPFWLTLVFPISMTAVDFFSASGSPFGSFGAAAYSQTGFTTLMQVTAVTGLWGISFIVNWFASTVSYAWGNNWQWATITRGLAIYLGVMALILGWSYGRLAMADTPQKEVQIGGFSLPEGGLGSMMTLLNNGDEDAFRQATADMNARQLAQIQSMAQAGAQIVVLQEGAGVGFAEEIDTLLTDAAHLAQTEGIYIVLPTAQLDAAGEEPLHNIVRIIDPNGDVVLEHVKYGGNQFEGSLPGSGELQTVETPYGKLSAVICWDADFPVTMMQAGQQEVDLLFVPSNDWLEVRDIHAGMATFRAVENGVSLFRQTGDGVSVVTDGYGRIVNRVDMFEDDAAGDWSNEQMVLTPIGSVNSLYPQIGDGFGLLSLIGLVGLLIFAWVKRKSKEA
ncbi:MAG: carbon-nitrogen hydrolase family protein [Ardenticatenaceae bacterium]|nr:carbon-nitrogen hydrolase family protein [Anaerolineales bacterium]MCB8922675.1 carbon-nitrogen hydrolase family protein [Ardenticatenaceae bacterium]MCB8991778.1 carbon-nitrogen hydrolase family protein [Ardenticatenaceae bacterium]MCB9003617.1 carbon-nitrogen hydrolase family protein [Ardenticatenaceae bacterium]